MIMKRLKALSVALLAGLTIGGAAYALNNDQNRNFQARELPSQQTHYYRFTVNYNDPNISTAQKFGALKANTFINRVLCHVTTAFNGGSTNVFTVGTSTTATEIITASTSNRSVDESTVGMNDITAAPSIGIGPTSGGDVTLYAKYTQTGTPATAGAVTCVMEFAPNNDM